MTKKNPPVLASRSETRAERTNTLATALIAKETDLRDAKTRRLRAARLEQEASGPEPKASKRKTASRKRADS